MSACAVEGFGTVHRQDDLVDGEPLAQDTLARRTLQLTAAGPQPPFEAHDSVTANLQVRGVPARQVTTTARADRRLPPMTAYDRLTSTYTADPGFEDLFAAPQVLAIPTTTKTVTIPPPSGPGAVIGGFFRLFEGLFGLAGCLLSLGRRCPSAPGPSAPTRQTTTEAVEGPRLIETTLSGSISLTSSELLAAGDATMLSATGSGRMELSGALPSQPSVPAAIAGKTVSVVTDLSYSARLVSPWPAPPDHRRRVLVGVAGLAALLLVCSAATAIGLRRLISPR